MKLHAPELTPARANVTLFTVGIAGIIWSGYNQNPSLLVIFCGFVGWPGILELQRRKTAAAQASEKEQREIAEQARAESQAVTQVLMGFPTPGPRHRPQPGPEPPPDPKDPPP